MSPIVRALCALSLACGLIASPAYAAPAPARYDAGAVGVASDQHVHLSAVFTAGRGELPPGPCRLTLRFFDERGAIVAETTREVAPGVAATLDYRPERLRAGERASVRAEVIAEADRSGSVPQVLPTIEVVDTPTGRAAVADPGGRGAFEPARADLGMFGIIRQQIARVNATCLGTTDDSGLPPGPCRVQIVLLDDAGRVQASQDLEIAAGATAALGLAAGELPAGERRALRAVVTSDGSEGGFVAVSVEVFDPASGRTSVLLPGSIAESWGWE